MSQNTSINLLSSNHIWTNTKMNLRAIMTLLTVGMASLSHCARNRYVDLNIAISECSEEVELWILTIVNYHNCNNFKISFSNKHKKSRRQFSIKRQKSAHEMIQSAQENRRYAEKPALILSFNNAYVRIIPLRVIRNVTDGIMYNVRNAN